MGDITTTVYSLQSNCPVMEGGGLIRIHSSSPLSPLTHQCPPYPLPTPGDIPQRQQFIQE
ncbi:hypothetical protein J6590_005380 [Homalodisca vitripennis]|nr:hypothetical protein J6590_005380 [Homalodisca vitripennis]